MSKIHKVLTAASYALINIPLKGFSISRSKSKVDIKGLNDGLVQFN